MTKAQPREKASSSWAKQAGCDGKTKMTQATATKTAKRGKYHLAPYHCKFCGWWHVGETLGKKQDKKRQSKMDGDSENPLVRARASR